MVLDYKYGVDESTMVRAEKEKERIKSVIQSINGMNNNPVMYRINGKNNNNSSSQRWWKRKKLLLILFQLLCVSSCAHAMVWKILRQKWLEGAHNEFSNYESTNLIWIIVFVLRCSPRDIRHLIDINGNPLNARRWIQVHKISTLLIAEYK